MGGVISAKWIDAKSTSYSLSELKTLVANSTEASSYTCKNTRIWELQSVSLLGNLMFSELCNLSNQQASLLVLTTLWWEADLGISSRVLEMNC